MLNLLRATKLCLAIFAAAVLLTGAPLAVLCGERCGPL